MTVSERSAGRRWTPGALRVVLASTAMQGSAALVPVLIGAMSLPLQRDLQLTDQSLGVAATCFWLGSAAAAGLLAPHVDRWGWRRAGGLALLILSVAMAGLGLLNASLTTTILWLAVAGATYGVCGPSSNAALAHEVPRELHGRALGLKQSSAPVSGILAGFAVPPLVLAIGWQWTFAIAALVPAAGYLTTRAARDPRGATDAAPDSPDPSSPEPDDRASTESDGGSTGGSTGVVGTLSAESVPVREAVGGPSAVSATTLLPLWVIASGAGLASLSVAALITFSLRTLTASGVSFVFAGAVLGIGSVLSIGIRLCAGVLTDRAGSDGLRPAAVMIGLGGAAMLLMITGNPVLTVLGCVLAMCTGWGWPALLLLSLLTHHRHQASRASGRFQLGTALGSAAGPSLFGSLVHLGGLWTGWVFAASASAISAALLWQAARRISRAGAN